MKRAWLLLAVGLFTLGGAEARAESRRYSFDAPAGYTARALGAGETTYARPVGTGSAEIYVRVQPGDPEAESPLTAEVLFEAEKATYADGELGTIRMARRIMLGGQPAFHLVITYQAGETADFESLVIAERGGEVVQLGLKYPAAQPPAAVLGDLDALLASWRWH